MNPHSFHLAGKTTYQQVQLIRDHNNIYTSCPAMAIKDSLTALRDQQ